MAENRIDGNLYVTGTLSMYDISLPSGVMTNTHVAAGAAFASTKLQHRHNQTYGQSGANADATQIIHVAKATGTLKTFVAGSIGVCTGATSTTIDLKKNGTTTLTAVITLDSDNVARVVEGGTVSVTAYVAGDVFEVVVDATSDSGDATGLFACAEFDEAAT